MNPLLKRNTMADFISYTACTTGFNNIKLSCGCVYKLNISIDQNAFQGGLVVFVYTLPLYAATASLSLQLPLVHLSEGTRNIKKNPKFLVILKVSF